MSAFFSFFFCFRQFFLHLATSKKKAKEEYSLEKKLGKKKKKDMAKFSKEKK